MMSVKGSTGSIRRDHRGDSDTHSSGNERSERQAAFHQPFSHVLQQIRSKAPRLTLRFDNGKVRTSTGDATDELRSSHKAPLDRQSNKSCDSSQGSLEGGEAAAFSSLTAADANATGLQSHGFDETDLIGGSADEEKVRFAIDAYRAKLERAQQEFDQLDEVRKTLTNDFVKLNTDVNAKAKEKFDARQLQLQNNSHLLQKKIAKYQDRIKQLEEKGIIDQSVLQEVKYAWQSMAKHTLGLPPIFKGGRLFGSNHNIRGDAVEEEGIQTSQTVGSPPKDVSEQVRQRKESEERSRSEERAERMERELSRVTESMNLRIQELQQLNEETAERAKRLEQELDQLKNYLNGLAQSQDQFGQQLSTSQYTLQRMQFDCTEGSTALDTRIGQLQAQMHASQLQQAEQWTGLEEAVEKNEARLTELEHRMQFSLPLHDNSKMNSGMMVTVVNSLIVILHFLLSMWMRLGRREVIILFTAMAVFFLSLVTSWWWG